MRITPSSSRCEPTRGAFERARGVGRLTALAAGLLLGALLTPADEPPPSETYYRDAVARLEQGNPQAAIPLLSHAVACRPDELRFSATLAVAYIKAKRWAEAESLLETLRSERSGEPAWIEARARLDAACGRWSAVDDLLTPHADRLSEAMLNLLAQARSALHRPTEAVAILHRAVRRYPRSELLWLALVDTTLALEQNALTLKRIAEARAAGCDSPEFGLRAARAHLALNGPFGAVRTVRAEDAQAGQFIRGGLLLAPTAREGEFLCAPAESAIYQIRAALDRGLDTSEAHLLHAQVWLAGNRPEMALAILRAHEASLADNEQSLRMSIEAMLGANALADVVRTVGEYERRYGRRGDSNGAASGRGDDYLQLVFRRIAELYNQRGADDLYREYLSKAAVLAPHDPDLCVRLGDALWETSRRETAATYYRRALEASPLHAERHRVLERLAE